MARNGFGGHDSAGYKHPPIQVGLARLWPQPVGASHQMDCLIAKRVEKYIHSKFTVFFYNRRGKKLLVQDMEVQ